MPAFEQEVTLHRPNRGLRAAAAVPALVALAATVLLAPVAGLHADRWLGVLLLAALFTAVGLVMSLSVRRLNPWPRKVRARLAVVAGGVTIDGSRVVDRSAVRRAYVQPWAFGAPTVRLVGRLGTLLLEVQVASENEGRALVDALELGVSHMAIRFSGLSPVLASRQAKLGFYALLGLATVGSVALPLLLHVGGAAAWLLLLLPGLLSVLPLLVPASIYVGADGVLTTWLGRKRFYWYADIAGIQRAPHGVRIWQHSGDVVVIPVKLEDGMGSPVFGGGAPGHLDALVARIQAAHAAAVAGKRPVDVVALVARGGRTAVDWVRAVRSLLGGDATDYRSNAIPEENLWRVAEDATAEETARVGAAVALRTRLDGDGRARLLRVAEASASPRVRVALRAAASAEGDEALVEAMETYEAERAG